jgi:hypothetical protein
MGMFPSSLHYRTGITPARVHPAVPARAAHTTTDPLFQHANFTQQALYATDDVRPLSTPPIPLTQNQPDVMVVSTAVLNNNAGHDDDTNSTQKKKKSLVEVPVELLILAVSGYLSTLNPAMASVITEQIDTSFFWNFNMLDYAGMGFPRVSRSLKRGAVPYDPETDHETQKRTGINQWFYVKKKQIENANWDNLGEEFLRESQAAPGALLLPTLLFTAIPLMSRFTGFPSGRRAFQLGGNTVETNHVQPLVSYLNQLKAENPSMPKQVEDRKVLLSTYYQSLFRQENHTFLTTPLPVLSVPINKPVTLFPIFSGIKERPAEPIYTLTLKQVEALAGKKVPSLKEQPIELTVGDITFTVARHPSPDFAKADAFILATKEPITMQALVKAWADSLASLTAFQLEHNGVAKATLPWGKHKNLYNQHQALMQSYTLLTNMLDVGVEVANKQFGSSLMENPSQLKLGSHLKQGKPFQINSFMTFANQADKIQDVIVAAFKQLDHAPSSVEPTVDNFIHSLKQTQHTMGAIKFIVTIGAAVWMSWWMWTLSHMLQAGRAYPANRLVRSQAVEESQEKPGLNQPITTATANNGNPQKPAGVSFVS